MTKDTPSWCMNGSAEAGLDGGSEVLSNWWRATTETLVGNDYSVDLCGEVLRKSEHVDFTDFSIVAGIEAFGRAQNDPLASI